MNTSSRFAVAVHVLTLLAQAPDAPLTSEYIAGSVNTNPVVIRRILGDLRQAGLVASQPGNRGGWRLLAAPAQISLRHVYWAVEEETLFPLPDRAPNPDCPVGRNIQRALDGVFREAAQAMEARLAGSTIAQMLDAVLAPAG